MKTDAPWQNIFKICLAQRKLNMSMLEYLDDILDWYNKRNSDHKNEFLHSLVSKYGEHDFRVRFEEVLSQLLTLHPSLLFPINLHQDKGKLRYRLLIRVFHPDRGVSDTKWLTTCSEIVNITYKDFVENYKEQERRAEVLWSEVLAYDADSSTNNRSNSIFNNHRSGSNPWFTLEHWRNLLGDPDNLQHKVVYGLSSLVVIALAVVLSSVVLEPNKVKTPVVTQEPIKIDQPASTQIVQTDSGIDNNDLGQESQTADLSLELDESDLGAENTSSQSESTQTFAEPNETPSQKFSQAAELALSSEDATATKPLTATDNLESASVNEAENLSEIGFYTVDDLELKNDFSVETVNSNQALIQKQPDNQIEVIADTAEYYPATDINKTSSLPQPTPNLAQAAPISSTCIELQEEGFGHPIVGGVIDVANLRLRSGPSKECAIIITLLPGRPISIHKYSTDGLWYYVSVIRKSKPKVSGWVSSQFVTVTGDKSLLLNKQELAANDLVPKDNVINQVTEPKALYIDSTEPVDFGGLKIDTAMQEVFQEYQDYFMAGDDLQLANLYINNANENGIRGIAAIKQSYKELFSNTQHRSLALKISDIQDDGFHSAQIKGQMHIGYSLNSNQFEDLRDFKMLLIKTQKGLKIALFNFG